MHRSVLGTMMMTRKRYEYIRIICWICGLNLLVYIINSLPNSIPGVFLINLNCSSYSLSDAVLMQIETSVELIKFLIILSILNFSF